jgi:hypothetical protein
MGAGDEPRYIMTYFWSCGLEASRFFPAFRHFVPMPLLLLGYASDKFMFSAAMSIECLALGSDIWSATARASAARFSQYFGGTARRLAMGPPFPVLTALSDGPPKWLRKEHWISDSDGVGRFCS